MNSSDNRDGASFWRGDSVLESDDELSEFGTFSEGVCRGWGELSAEVWVVY